MRANGVVSVWMLASSGCRKSRCFSLKLKARKKIDSVLETYFFKTQYIYFYTKYSGGSGWLHWLSVWLLISAQVMIPGWASCWTWSLLKILSLSPSAPLLSVLSLSQKKKKFKGWRLVCRTFKMDVYCQLAIVFSNKLLSRNKCKVYFIIKNVFCLILVVKGLRITA